MTLRLATAARSTMATALMNLIDADAGAGTLKIYSGAQPADPNSTPAGTLLATVTLDVTVGSESGGVLTFDDPAPVTGVAAGTAGCFLIEDASGDNVCDGTVTATGGGGDLTLATTTISVGVTVDITSFSITVPQ